MVCFLTSFFYFIFLVRKSSCRVTHRPRSPPLSAHITGKYPDKLKLSGREPQQQIQQQSTINSTKSNEIPSTKKKKKSIKRLYRRLRARNVLSLSPQQITPALPEQCIDRMIERMYQSQRLITNTSLGTNNNGCSLITKASTTINNDITLLALVAR